MSTLFTDLSLIEDDLLHDLEIIGGKKFLYEIKYLRDSWMAEMDNQGSLIEPSDPRHGPGYTCLRRLSAFADKEGKTRVIGILDYFSQNALGPLHTWLNERLKQIDQDCTFDQSSFKEKSRGWLKG